MPQLREQEYTKENFYSCLFFGFRKREFSRKQLHSARRFHLSRITHCRPCAGDDQGRTE